MGQTAQRNTVIILLVLGCAGGAVARGKPEGVPRQG